MTVASSDLLMIQPRQGLDFHSTLSILHSFQLQETLPGPPICIARPPLLSIPRLRRSGGCGALHLGDNVRSSLCRFCRPEGHARVMGLSPKCEAYLLTARRTK